MNPSLDHPTLEQLKALYDSGRLTRGELYARIMGIRPEVTGEDVGRVFGDDPPVMAGFALWVLAVARGAQVIAGEQRTPERDYFFTRSGKGDHQPALLVGAPGCPPDAAACVLLPDGTLLVCQDKEAATAVSHILRTHVHRQIPPEPR
jgi:hypothetical protein